MACCTQKDFYEASQLHLFRSASIKLAEALAARADSRGAGDCENRRHGRSQRARLETNNKKLVENGGEKHMLLRKTSERLWVVYLCAVRLLISAN